MNSRLCVLTGICFLFSMNICRGQLFDKSPTYRFSLSSYLTPSLTIKRQYEPNVDFDMYTKPAIGFEARIQKTKYLMKDIGIEIAVVLGAFPYDMRVREDTLYTGLDFDFDYGYTSHEAVYIGAGFSMIFNRQLNEKYAISIHPGFDLSYTPRQLIEDYFYATKNGNFTLYYYSFGIGNDKGYPFLVPRVEISLDRKVSERWTISAGISAGGSGRKIYQSDYMLFGKAGTLNGSFYKRFQYVGVFVAASFRKEKRTAQDKL